MKPRVILADDHTLVMEGLERLLADEFEVCRMVNDGDALKRAIREDPPDVAVTDISMPKSSGLQVVRELCDEGVRTRFIVLTMHDDPYLAREAMGAGARAFMLKSSAGTELKRVVHEVMAGGTYTGPVGESARVGAAAGSEPDQGQAKPKPRKKLTPRQRQVLRLVAEGRSMKGVARALSISRRTVESHKYEIMRRIGANTNAELVLSAVRLGILPITGRPAGTEADRAAV